MVNSINSIIYKTIDIFDEVVVDEGGSVPATSADPGQMNLFMELFIDAYAVLRTLGLMLIIIVGLLSILRYILSKNTNNARHYSDWQKVLSGMIIQGFVLGAFSYIAGLLMDIANSITTALH